VLPPYFNKEVCQNDACSIVPFFNVAKKNETMSLGGSVNYRSCVQPNIGVNLMADLKYTA
jgi:hypothetical protein